MKKVTYKKAAKAAGVRPQVLERVKSVSTRLDDTGEIEINLTDGSVLYFELSGLLPDVVTALLREIPTGYIAPIKSHEIGQAAAKKIRESTGSLIKIRATCFHRPIRDFYQI